MLYKQSGPVRLSRIGSHLGSPTIRGGGSFQINDFVIDNNYETWIRYTPSDQKHIPIYEGISNPRNSWAYKQI